MSKRDFKWFLYYLIASAFIQMYFIRPTDTLADYIVWTLVNTVICFVILKIIDYILGRRE